jgi:hypothetical protein
MHGRLKYLLVSIALLASPAWAALPDEIQVYDDEIDSAGQRSLELHVNTTPSGNSQPGYPGEQVALHTTRITPEISWGLGHHLESALYIPTAINAQGHADLAGLRGRLKWLPWSRQDGSGGGFLGVSSELSRLAYRYDAARVSSELRGIAGWHDADWLLAFNPVLAWGLTRGYTGSTDVSINLKLLRTVSPTTSLGTEYYADYGPIGRFLPADQRARTGYAIAEFNLTPETTLHLGLGRGWGSADKWTVKAILGMPL